MTKEHKTTAADLLRMIDLRHQPPEWVVLDEVSNGTGFTGTNRADALAMSIWPSRGISLHGFEIKVSRADLLKELATPAKADAVGQFCEYWWLVVADKKLVDGVAVPETWGVLAPAANVLRRVKEASKVTPTAWTPTFVASMMRNQASGLVSKKLLDDEKAARRKIIDEEVAKRTTTDVHEVALNKLAAKVRSFQEATGCSMEEWKHADIRAALMLVEEHGWTGVVYRLEKLRADSKQLSETIEKAFSLLPAHEGRREGEVT